MSKPRSLSASPLVALSVGTPAVAGTLNVTFQQPQPIVEVLS